MTAKTNLATTLFPLGYAQGPAFCNRDTERDRLKRNMLEGTHTYIMGRRRYGKTSLVRQATTELARKRTPRVHVETIDLMTVHTLEALEALLREAVGKLTASFLPRNKRVLGKLESVLSAFKPEIVIRKDSFEIKLFTETPSTTNIVDLLSALDDAAKLYGRRAVLVIDEFQQVAHIDKAHTIEGAIRNVAQRTKALSLVYLGSERATLAKMFENDKRPLFNSGSEAMRLGRISEADYVTYLQNAATLRWNKPIRPGAVDAILTLTDRHPSYVNILCRDLWRISKAPTAAAVEAAWVEVMDRERHQAQRELMSLAHAQRTVLQAIATQPTKQPTAKEFLSRFRIAVATMARSIDVLMERDFVRETEDSRYEVVDPLIKGILKIR